MLTSWIICLDYTLRVLYILSIIPCDEMLMREKVEKLIIEISTGNK